MEPETSLAQRVAKGGMWVFASRGVEKLLGFVKLVILARLLAPNDFGLFGIALLAMSTLETFSQTGFQSALVQKKGDITRFLDTAWTISLIRGTVLSIIVFFSAPYIAHFFNSPKASLIIQVIGISLFLGGFTNIGILYFQKELEFNKLFIYQLLTTLFEFGVVILASLILKSVWALVFGMLAASLIGLVASYVIHPYRPHFMLDLSKAKELFGFGKWVFWSSILIFLVTQGDDAFVGKFLGATMLGFYQMAYRISNMPATEISHVIFQVTFPVYSNIQNNLPRLRKAYLRVLQLTTFLSCPLAGFIFVFAPDFTKIFLGDKWMQIVPVMQVLVFAGLMRSIAAISAHIFYAVGKPKIDTILQIIRLVVLAAFIYPFAITWGLLGIAIIVFLSIFISCIGAVSMSIKITRCSAQNFAKIIIFPLLNIVVTILLILEVRTFVTLGILSFITLTFIYVLLYLVITYLTDKFFNYGIQFQLKESIKLLKCASNG